MSLSVLLFCSVSYLVPFNYLAIMKIFFLLSLLFIVCIVCLLVCLFACLPTYVDTGMCTVLPGVTGFLFSPHFIRDIGSAIRSGTMVGKAPGV